MNRKIKILLAEDNVLFADGFRQLILSRRKKDFTVVETVAKESELLPNVKKLQPDLVVISPTLHQVKLYKAITIIKRVFPSVRILLFIEPKQETSLADIVQAGAHGMISKNAPKDQILQALLEVGSGSSHFSPTVSDNIIQWLSQYPITKRKNKISLFTDKEVWIIRLVCQQLKTREIAETLHLSIRTVEDYRYKIYKKIGIKNTAGLVFYASQHKHLLKE
ncbi:MAG: response regulator [Flavisolibacter sp.]